MHVNYVEKSLFRLPKTIAFIPGTLLPFSPCEPDVFQVGIMRFLLPRKMRTSGSVFVFPPYAFCFPRGCLFVRHHPGRPAYVTYIRATARYTLRLAGGFAPLTPKPPGQRLRAGQRQKAVKA